MMCQRKIGEIVKHTLQWLKCDIWNGMRNVLKGKHLINKIIVSFTFTIFIKCVFGASSAHTVRRVKCLNLNTPFFIFFLYIFSFHSFFFWSRRTIRNELFSFFIVEKWMVSHVDVYSLYKINCKIILKETSKIHR